MKRQQTESRGRWLLALAASLLLMVVAALPAAAQASRTRPPEQPSTSSSSGSSSTSSSSSGRTAVRSSGNRSSSTSSGTRPSGGDRAVSTRPSGGGGVTSIDNDTRTHRYRGQRPYYGGGHYRYYDPWYWYPYRYSWWLGYYPYAYGPYYGAYGAYGGPYGHYPPAYPSRASRANGALDLDLKPGDTQIYLNGQLIGTADDFDGWPEYLWLEEGDYHFIFYKQGHRSIVREYKVLPGVVIDVEDRLERGESPPPEELFPPPTERRDARLRDEAERRRRAETEAQADWRLRRERTRVEDQDIDQGREGDFGSLTLTVVPSDASVYLDGRLIGTGDDLARLRRGLTVDAGDHVLEIVRPGHQPVEREFRMTSGQVLTMAIELEEM